MKRNLRVKKLVQEGYTTSKDIIDYNTNKKIVKFIKMFVDKMKSKPQSVLVINKPKKQVLEKLPKIEKGKIKNTFEDVKKILKEDQP